MATGPDVYIFSHRKPYFIKKYSDITCQVLNFVYCK